MKSLDTNVIIRFLVNDDIKQGEIVKKLFIKAEKENTAYFVSIPVILELIYVLDSVYGFTRKEILDAFNAMILMPVLIFENTDTIQKFLSSAEKTKIELEDLFIGIVAREAGCKTTITFDKKASKSEFFELLT